MTSVQSRPFHAVEGDSLAALLSLAGHRCGHDVELSFDLEIIEAARAVDGVCWSRDDTDPEAGPRFRAAMAVICDGRAVSALVVCGVVSPEDAVADALADAAFAAGRMIRPLEWRAIQDGFEALAA